MNTEPTPINPGDKAHIGKGKTTWTVQELWRQSHDGPLLATLHNGWNSTTVEADRLVSC